MRTIWKYPIPLEPRFSIAMPIGAHVLCVQMQAGLPHMWAGVEAGKPAERRYFALVGTGGEAPEGNVDYLGTFQDAGLVFHLFETEET